MNHYTERERRAEDKLLEMTSDLDVREKLQNPSVSRITMREIERLCISWVFAFSSIGWLLIYHKYPKFHVVLEKASWILNVAGMRLFMNP